MKRSQAELSKIPRSLRAAVQRKMPRDCQYVLIVADADGVTLDGTLSPADAVSVMWDAIEGIKAGVGVVEFVSERDVLNGRANGGSWPEVSPADDEGGSHGSTDN